jgi:hypothetical protein
MDEHDDIASALWRNVVQSLVAKGMTPAEAIDGPNLILNAYKRQREESQAPESGKRSTG